MNYTVILRCKNNENTIADCIESILKQDISPVEILLVDSGSEDRTLEIAAKYNLVKIIHYPKDILFNYSKALNFGISQVSSEYILILSSHVQLIASNTIRWMLYFMNGREYVANVSLYRTDKKKIKEYHTIQDIDWAVHNKKSFRGNSMFNYCSLIRKKDWQEYPFNEQIPRCEDQDWIKYFLYKNNRVSVLANVLVFYKNPYYNYVKDAWDYIVLGEFIHPFYLSNGFIYSLFKKSISKILKGEISGAVFDLKVFFLILKHKFIRPISIVSSYNKNQ